MLRNKNIILQEIDVLLKELNSLNNSKNPYLMTYEIITNSKYNKDFGDNKICECGHPYYRHFDTYEQMEAIGCKYCGCFEFKNKN